MKMPELPDLPKPTTDHYYFTGTVENPVRAYYFTADQLQAYAIAYGERVREACAKIVLSKHDEIEDMPSLAADMLASAIRGEEK